jgi:ribosomal protein S18 acetylase RimI-like enzyme
MPLRPAQPADVPAVVAVFHAARPSFIPVLHTAEEDRGFFAGQVDRMTISGDVAGFLVRDGSTIDHLYVHPDHHRHGHGRALLRAAQAERDELDLWVFRRNTGAIAFYEAHGFAIVGETAGDNEEGLPDYRMAWSRVAPGPRPR